MRTSTLVIFIFFLFGTGICSIEAQDSLRWDQKAATFIIDTLLESNTYRNPKKATILSAVLPGAGQAYNRQYYKIHVIYGAMIGVMYAADFNKRQYDLYSSLYENRLLGIEDDPDFAQYPTAALKNARDESRKNMELSYIGLGFVYLLNVVDAYVSSHLSSFDVTEDLSFRPKLYDINLISNSPYPCIGIKIDL